MKGLKEVSCELARLMGECDQESIRLGVLDGGRK